MSKVKFSKTLNDEMTIWRYLSLDKLIYLLKEKSLFLTPLSYFMETDPFEGYLPEVIFKPMIKNLQDAQAYSESIIEQDSSVPYFQEIKNHMKQMSEISKKNLEVTYESGTKRTCVSCWHQNNIESEAMWKLYTDNNKGIAIKSNISLLRKAININNIPVMIGKVQYIDYFDPSLADLDFSNWENSGGFFKRKEYSHENEIRICHKPFVDPSSMQHFVLDSMFEGKPWNGFEIKPFALKINPHELIEEIIISPYTKEPFASSVVDVCKKNNIPENKVRKSNLLDDYKKMIFYSN
jgi:hypothetical protein